jgi:two-component system, chemotaxis family, protein-glutamate methylesterase/glutaminase
VTTVRTGKGIRALVVEHSAATRERLVRILQADRDIVVVAHAATSLEAIHSTVTLRPDVVIFDVHTADRQSRHAIEQIMSRAPTPILVLSNNKGGRHSPAVVDALVAGALDALPNPNTWTTAAEAQLRRTVRVISGVHVIRHPRRGTTSGQDSSPTATTGQRVVVIGASTGGPSAVATVLSGLGGLTAPVLVVQHLHVDFTAGLVEWMARVSALPVELAVHGQRARPGRVYFPPGGVHLRLAATSQLELGTAPETLHRPSVDELFLSVAAHVGSAAIGVLMTGMGDDGAKGMLAIHERGGRTLAQDEASCAVFGMPAAAQRLGAVSQLLPPEGLARAIMHASREVLP